MQNVLDRRTRSQDLTASLVVLLVALPLCMGVAIASGMPPAAGIMTGIVGGTMVGVLSSSQIGVFFRQDSKIPALNQLKVSLPQAKPSRLGRMFKRDEFFHECLCRS